MAGAVFGDVGVLLFMADVAVSLFSCQVQHLVMLQYHFFVAGAILLMFGDVGVSLFVAGAAFDDVGVSLFVAGTAFGEIWVNSRGAKCCNFHYKMRLQSVAPARSPRLLLALWRRIL